MKEVVYVFGYGSLMNDQSRARTVEENDLHKGVVLDGYQRKMNAVCENIPAVALNIVPNIDMSVEGVVFGVTEEGMQALKDREDGYSIVDVSDSLSIKLESPVYTFIAPDVSEYKDKKMYLSYLNVCLEGVDSQKREKWIKDTIFECETLDDTDNPLYKNQKNNN